MYVSSVNNNQLLFNRFLDKNSVEKSFAIIFYVDGDQKDWIRKRGINANNVKVYQLYFGKENTIKTDIYKNNKGKYEKIKKLSSAVNYISANDMYKIAGLFNGTTSIFMLENINESFNYIDFKPNSLREYELESNIRTYLIEKGARERGISLQELKTKNNFELIYDEDLSDDKCTSPCNFISGGPCTWVNDNPRPGYWNCQPRVTWCLFREVKKISKLQEPIASKRSREEEENILYLLRDGFLFLSDKGKELISQYYELSSYSKELSDETMRRINKIKPLIIDKVEVFMKNRASKNILISEKEKNSFLEVLDFMKKDYSSRDYYLLIEKIKKEVLEYSNKSSSQINSMILQ